MERGLLGVLVLLALAACEPPPQSPDAFRDAWLNAANQGDTATLYLWLDSASRRRVREELEIILGLDEGAQIAVAAQLKIQLRDLERMTPARYFGLLWQNILNHRRLNGQVVQDTPDSATLTVTPNLDDDLGPIGPPAVRVQPLHLPLIREAGQWRWSLPAPTNPNTPDQHADSHPKPTHSMRGPTP